MVCSHLLSVIFSYHPYIFVVIVGDCALHGVEGLTLAGEEEGFASLSWTTGNRERISEVPKQRLLHCV